jgi:hypothetical protein
LVRWSTVTHGRGCSILHICGSRRHRIKFSIVFFFLIQIENIEIKKYQGLVLDTQGSELLILKGAEKILRNFSYIKVEAADFNAYEGCCQIDELIESGDKDAAFSAMRRELIKHPSDPEIRLRARTILNNSESTIDAIPLSIMEAELQDFKLLLDAFEADLERQGF